MGVLSNKKVLITGGSSGIGSAIALQAAEAGAQVLFTYAKKRERALQLLEKIINCSPRSCLLQSELTHPDDIAHLVKNAIAKLGKIDILVNNAGVISRHASFLDINFCDLNSVQFVNITAPFLLSQAIASHMVQKKINGNILNISSISASVISPGLTHYECSKAALNALTRSSSAELAKYNIRVNAIEPGLVKTNINQEQWQNHPEVWQQRSKKIPLGKTGEPTDIANLAIFLMSDQANWITGSIFTVDGGMKSSFVSK